MVRAQWQNEFIVNFATSIFFSSRTFLVFLYKLLLWDIVLSVCVCMCVSDWYPRNRISRHNKSEPRRERVHESTNPKITNIPSFAFIFNDCWRIVRRLFAFGFRFRPNKKSHLRLHFVCIFFFLLLHAPLYISLVHIIRSIVCPHRRELFSCKIYAFCIHSFISFRFVTYARALPFFKWNKIRWPGQMLICWSVFCVYCVCVPSLFAFVGQYDAMPLQINIFYICGQWINSSWKINLKKYKVSAQQ